MRIMIDTNVFLDVLTQREPFYAASRQVLELCENDRVQGFLTASSVTDIYYLIHRHLHDTEQSYQALGAVLKIAKVLPVTNEDVLSAYLLPRAAAESGTHPEENFAKANSPMGSRLAAPAATSEIDDLPSGRSSYLRRAPDFEDCLLAACAQVNHCDMIVTRNVKDFAGLGIPAMAPDEFLRI